MFLLCTLLLMTPTFAENQNKKNMKTSKLTLNEIKIKAVLKKEDLSRIKGGEGGKTGHWVYDNISKTWHWIE